MTTMSEPPPIEGEALAAKEAIIAKLHTQLEDEVAAHDRTTMMLHEVKNEAHVLQQMKLQSDWLLDSIVAPLVSMLQKEQASDY